MGTAEAACPELPHRVSELGKYPTIDSVDLVQLCASERGSIRWRRRIAVQLWQGNRWDVQASEQVVPIRRERLRAQEGVVRAWVAARALHSRRLRDTRGVLLRPLEERRHVLEDLPY